MKYRKLIQEFGTRCESNPLYLNVRTREEVRRPSLYMRPETVRGVPVEQVYNTWNEAGRQKGLDCHIGENRTCWIIRGLHKMNITNTIQIVKC